MNPDIPIQVNGKFVQELFSGKWNEMAPIKIEERVVKITSFEGQGVRVGTKGTVKASILSRTHGWQFWVKWDGERNPVLISLSKIKKEGSAPH